jgi:hypothetical protein
MKSLYRRPHPWTGPCRECGYRHPDTYRQCPRGNALMSTRTFYVRPAESKKPLNWLLHSGATRAVRVVVRTLWDRLPDGLLREIDDVLLAASEADGLTVGTREVAAYREAIRKRNKVLARFEEAAYELLRLCHPMGDVMCNNAEITKQVEATLIEIRSDGFYAFSPGDPALSNRRGSPRKDWRPTAERALVKLGARKAEARILCAELAGPRRAKYPGKPQ